ncbi:MAG: heavy metal translocating P-type ATPase metal-binding domain-containing protein, partial [Phycisphaerales bacterium]|nr:heavy metal translocating P-type ATPase metal-binding domain-containing protein [Phycisphaerales bacterium]
MSSTRASAARQCADVACAHCNLPVPAGLIAAESEHSFCCEGCRSVFEIIHSCGLEQYYRLRAEAESENRPAATSGRRYEE